MRSVRANHCMMCAACVASCPINVLNVNVNEEPVIKGPCAACQVCYYSCPRLELPLDEIEYYLFGRTRKPEEESLGIYRNIYSARALDEDIWHAGQDGGTVIALMTHALQIDMINCFATSDFTNSNSVFVLGSGMALKTVPVLGDTAADVLRTAGSKYTHGGALGVLSDAAASYPDGRVGLVALPCELQGLWRMYTSLQATVKFGGSWIRGGRPVLTLGLFCSKVYTHDHLVTGGPVMIADVRVQGGDGFAPEGQDERIRPSVPTWCAADVQDVLVFLQPPGHIFARVQGLLLLGVVMGVRGHLGGPVGVAFPQG